MLKKALVGILSLSVLAAGGGALIYQSNQTASAAPEPAAPAADLATPAPDVPGNANRQGAQAGQPELQQPVQQAASLNMVGEPWSASGTITSMDDFGLTLSLADSSEVYVELGPPAFWQAQGVTLTAGMPVTIDGFSGDAGYHTGVLTTADGQQIQLRTTDGQPLWSGGAANGSDGTNGHGNGGNGAANATGAQDGENIPQPQVQVDEWITVEGTITAMNRSQVTMQTIDGQTLMFQMGQPSFAEAQGITFQIGDRISVLGFYQGTQFSAGEVTQLATGQTLMLRDPNGRPLWAGPGGNQAAGGQGGAGNGNGGNGGNGRNP